MTISQTLAKYLEKAGGPLEPFTQVELTLKLLAEHIIKELPHPQEMLEEFKILHANARFQNQVLNPVSTCSSIIFFLYSKAA